MSRIGAEAFERLLKRLVDVLTPAGPTPRVLGGAPVIYHPPAVAAPVKVRSTSRSTVIARGLPGAQRRIVSLRRDLPRLTKTVACGGTF
jgi:hypothetical protein